jgi:zinc transporter ZupT
MSEQLTVAALFIVFAMGIATSLATALFMLWAVASVIIRWIGAEFERGRQKVRR